MHIEYYLYQDNPSLEDTLFQSAVGIAQQIRAFVVIEKNKALVSSSYVVIHNHLQLWFLGADSLLCPP